jgi:phosphohistidine phosphatase
MKTLYVLRHAKAERDSDSRHDFDRPLAKRGWRDGEAVGREMRELGLEPDAVLASPAKRAAETVEAIARGYGPLTPSYEPRIYDAPVDRLLDVVRDADDVVQRLLLVGHNPGLENLILRLSGDDSCDHRDRVAEGFPTAALAVLQLPAQKWADVEPASGKIAHLIVPKELD